MTLSFSNFPLNTEANTKVSLINKTTCAFNKFRKMRENTPPASPFHDEDDELVYVGDDIDEVIEQLEQIPDDEAIEEEGECGSVIHCMKCNFLTRF